MLLSRQRFGWGVALALAGSTLGGALALAQDSAPSLSVNLQYQEVSQSVAGLGLSVVMQSATFSNEPPVSGRVFRGKLSMGPGDDNALPFVWAKSQGKLFLDLNRNGNFADDTNAVFTSSQGDYQQFPNIGCTFKTAQGPQRRLIGISLYNWGNRVNGSAECRCFFEGRAELGGKEWQVGVVEGANGKPAWLLLRPWSEQDKPFTGGGPSLEAVQFRPRLFVGSEGYELECVENGAAQGPGYRLTFKPQRPELGELKLTGQYIERLVLENGSKDGWLVVIDRPEKSIKVPVGVYGSASVYLKRGTTAAHRDANRYGGGPKAPGTRVTARNLAVLAAGGPLTNTISPRQQGRVLVMEYKLLGADGADYQLIPTGRRASPRFAAFKNGKEIASGDFQFG